MSGVNREQEIKALVFDAYGTLFDTNSVISICNELFPDHGEALSQIWRTKQLEYTWLRSLMERYADFWKVTEDALIFACKTLGLPCESSIRDRLMEAYLHLNPYPEVQQALNALSNYTLAILSNGSPRMLKAMVENAGLERTFTHIISADEVCVYKPSPRVYQLALEKIGLNHFSIGFVSSNSFDVNGAKSFGFWTCCVNRSNINTWDELGFSPDVTVNSLKDLANIISLSTNH
ncbi:MAG: haloacid dehalogenase type II [Thermodesulfobacteriota bacterium]